MKPEIQPSSEKKIKIYKPYLFLLLISITYEVYYSNMKEKGASSTRDIVFLAHSRHLGNV